MGLMISRKRSYGGLSFLQPYEDTNSLRMEEAPHLTLLVSWPQTSTSRMKRNKFLLLISYPVDDILLWQLE